MVRKVNEPQMPLEVILLYWFADCYHQVGKKRTHRYARVRRSYIEQKFSNGEPECALCDLPVRFNDATIDHIVRWADSYSLRTDTRNFQLAHRWCNEFRGQIMGLPGMLEQALSGSLGVARQEIARKVLIRTNEYYKRFEDQIFQRPDLSRIDEHVD